MKKEKVLEIVFMVVWDNWAWRITKQNEKVLKRDNFIDKKIEVMSDGGSPDFVKDTNYLFIRGGDEEGDGIIRICTAEEKALIEEKVKAINEKYGIEKRWQAEYGKIYYYMNEFFQTTWIRENHNCYSNKKYENGNYFKTEKEALEYAKYMKQCSHKWHEMRCEDEI
mgnify:CR=1 FL=1